jgi:hypothetical protein
MTALSAINEQNAEWYTNRGYHLFTITIAAPGVLTRAGHRLDYNERVKLFTTGALPTGLTADTYYYVIPLTEHTFKLAASPDGAAITTTGSQSGSHYYASDKRRMLPAYQDNR